MTARAELSRSAIRGAALATFCERGYRTTTLEEIGARVGVTRGAVLHHFKSKAGLLAAVVGPYLELLADLLAGSGVTEPPSAAQRRALVTDLVALMLQHRGVVRLLATDVGARSHFRPDDDWVMPRDRLVTLLLGSRPTALRRLQVVAAIGAIVWPVVGGELDVDIAPVRAELVNAALAVLERKAPSSDSVPSARAGSSRRLRAAVASQ